MGQNYSSTSIAYEYTIKQIHNHLNLSIIRQLLLNLILVEDYTFNSGC